MNPRSLSRKTCIVGARIAIGNGLPCKRPTFSDLAPLLKGGAARACILYQFSHSEYQSPNYTLFVLDDLHASFVHLSFPTRPATEIALQKPFKASVDTNELQVPEKEQVGVMEARLAPS